jgi:protoporphyrinogen oxidase
LRIAAQGLFPDQWIYVHEPGLRIGRSTNFRNWAPELYGDSQDTILALGLWCDPGDEQWRQADDLQIALATRDLLKTGLIGCAGVTGGHVVRIPNCYPVYDLGYQDRIAILKSHLQKIPGLHVIGRGGAFRCNNQGSSILMGMMAAENIARGRDHGLWSVNTDRDYQDAAFISDTGLVIKSA